MPMQSADQSLFALCTTPRKIGHDINRRAVGILDAGQASWEGGIATTAGLLILGKKLQWRTFQVVLDIVCVVLWMGDGRTEVVCNSLKVCDPKGMLVLLGKRDHLIRIQRINESFGFFG